MFFDKEGILDIDEMIVNNASFMAIMENGVMQKKITKA